MSQLLGRTTPPHGRRSSESMAAGFDQAMTALSYLLGGLMFYGGLGWLAAHFLHLVFLLPIGIVVGLGLSTYLMIQRYGKAGNSALEKWVEDKKAKEVEWARLAGRPEPRGGRQSTAGEPRGRG